MNKKQIMMATALVSTLALSGCESNDEIIEKQQQAEQINMLGSKIKVLESELPVKMPWNGRQTRNSLPVNLYQTDSSSWLTG